MKINVTNAKQPINLLVEAGTYEKQYKTAEGNPVILTDAWANYPLKSLGVIMNPIQDLHGYDHPWVGGAGKNLFNIDSVSSFIKNGSETTARFSKEDGIITNSNSIGAYGWYPFKCATIPTYSGQITISFDGKLSGTNSSNGIGIVPYNVSGSAFASATQQQYASAKDVWAHYTATFALNSDASDGIIIAIEAWNTGNTLQIKNIQVEIGSTATAYEPYENICPISGWSSVDVYKRGVNVWDEEWEQGDLNSITGEEISSTTYIRGVNYTPCVPNVEYYGKANSKIWLYWYDQDKNYISNTSGGFQNTTKTAPSTAHFFRLVQYASTYDNGTSINYPSTDTNYHAYNGQTITKDLGQTVYGCKVDIVSGLLTVDRAMVDMGDLTWTHDVSLKRFYASISGAKKPTSSEVVNAISSIYNAVSMDTFGNSLTLDSVMAMSSGGNLSVRNLALDIGTATDFKTAMSGVQLVYELANPQTIQLTPEEVKTLMKETILMTNADSLLVEYRTNER